MRKIYVLCTAAIIWCCNTYAQDSDTLRNIALPDVNISAKRVHVKNSDVMVNSEYRDKEFLRKNFNGNIMQTIENIPGVRAMNIGSGFAKPMIRGMAFNRVSVVENGIKQEGQQWGADHGLEVDAFSVNSVNVIKGPASLLYGSDAMGGVIELNREETPKSDMIYGNVSTLYRSVNGYFGGSVMLGLNKGSNFWMIRYSESHFGDYKIPADTIVYLTRKLPVHNGSLKNTAGYERDGSITYRKSMKQYSFETSISDVYQKSGFYPGAHGIPDISRLNNDGDRYNIELPYSDVNHFKGSAEMKVNINSAILTANIGYQNNHRREMSLFHTHYSNQEAPEKDPDKELDFTLQTVDAYVRSRFIPSTAFEHTIGVEIKHQENGSGGYSFLLPDFRQNSEAIAWTFRYNKSNRFSFSGGIRYDNARIDIKSHQDRYLAEYLLQQGYSDKDIEEYSWNSRDIKRDFSDMSFSLGAKYAISPQQELLVNIGRSFRTPQANELSANGVHHGTFRHEQGSSNLDSEKGWQLDISYNMESKKVTVIPSIFFNYFENYIFLRPSGEWSILPHAGQIYRFTSTRAVITGGELMMNINLNKNWLYELSAEYIYTYNCKEKIPLSFSPQSTLRNRVTWRNGLFSIHAEGVAIAKQSRVDRNEEVTGGAFLLNMGSTAKIKMGSLTPEITVSVHNITNRRYYNHLSYYRKIEVPEPGRNIQILINLPFKKLL